MPKKYMKTFENKSEKETLPLSNNELIKDAFLIKINKKYKKISKNEIDFISSEGKYSNLHIGTRVYSIRTSLKNIEEVLPSQFLRVHASFIVNTSKIESINTESSQIDFEVGVSIPYSRTYKSSLLNKYSIM